METANSLPPEVPFPSHPLSAWTDAEVLTVSSGLTERAQTLCKLNRFEAAAADLKKAILIMNEKMPIDHRTAAAAFDLAEVMSKHLRMMEEAEAQMKQSLMIEQQLDPSSELCAHIAIQLGRIYLELSETPAAQAVFESVLTAYPHPDSSAYLFAESYIGWACIMNNEYARGDAILSKAIDTCRRLFPHARELGVVLKLLSAVYEKKHDFHQAEALLLECVEVSAEQTSHPEDLAIARSILGGIYQRHGMNEKAEKELKEAVKIHTVHYPGSGRTLLAISDLGYFYLQTGNIEAAEETFESGVELHLTHNLNPRVTAEAWMHLARFLARKEIAEHEKAYSAFIDALTILDESDPLDLKVAYCYTQIGEICWETQHNEDAEEKFKKAVEIYRVKDSKGTPGAILKLGHFYDCTGNEKQAKMCYNEAVHLCTLLYPESKELGEAESRLGLYYYCKNNPKALEHYATAVSIFERVRPLSIELLNAKVKIAKC